MCTLKKGEDIVLESGEQITVKSSILLAGEKGSGLETFLNDHDLATYAAESSGHQLGEVVKSGKIGATLITRRLWLNITSGGAKRRLKTTHLNTQTNILNSISFYISGSVYKRRRKRPLVR